MTVRKLIKMLEAAVTADQKTATRQVGIMLMINPLYCYTGYANRVKLVPQEDKGSGKEVSVLVIKGDLERT